MVLQVIHGNMCGLAAVTMLYNYCEQCLDEHCKLCASIRSVFAPAFVLPGQPIVCNFMPEFGMYELRRSGVNSFICWFMCCTLVGAVVLTNCIHTLGPCTPTVTKIMTLAMVMFAAVLVLLMA